LWSFSNDRTSEASINLSFPLEMKSCTLFSRRARITGLKASYVSRKYTWVLPSPSSSSRVHPDALDHNGFPMASYRHDSGRFASVIHSHDWALPLDKRYFGTWKSQCRTRPLPSSSPGW
jgi:hypothetical protein